MVQLLFPHGPDKLNVSCYGHTFENVKNINSMKLFDELSDICHLCEPSLMVMFISIAYHMLSSCSSGHLATKFD